MGKAAFDALFFLQAFLQKGCFSQDFCEVEKVYRLLAESLGRTSENFTPLPPVSQQYIDDLHALYLELDRMFEISPQSAHWAVVELREQTRIASAAGGAAHMLKTATKGEPPGPDPMADRAAFYAMVGLSETLGRLQDGQNFSDIRIEIEIVYREMAAALGRHPDDPTVSIPRSYQQEVRDLIWELHRQVQIYPRAAHKVMLELREMRQMESAAATARAILKNAEKREMG